MCAMTVDELIEQLAHYPGDYQVLVYKDEMAGGLFGQKFGGDWPIEVVPGHYDGSGYRGRRLSRFVPRGDKGYFDENAVFIK
jgi:hypothetical protein